MPTGVCTIERMHPGKTIVAMFDPFEFGHRNRFWGSPLMREVPVDVPADGAVAVRIGGGGAEVTGRFTAEARDVPWKYAIARLYRAWPEGVPVPKPADWRDEVLMRRSIPVEVRPDGTFRATDVPPGDWRMDAMVFVEQSGTDRVRYVGRMAKQFHVPARRPLTRGREGTHARDRTRAICPRSSTR